MNPGPSKKCSEARSRTVIQDEELKRWLMAHYGVKALSFGPFRENGKVSNRIRIHFIAESTKDYRGADGFIGGWLAAKGINLNS